MERRHWSRLEEQDRSLLGSRGYRRRIAVGREGAQLRPGGPYQLQAAIAALHAEAATPQETDWPQIAALYAKLLEMNPSPVIALNHAVAVAMGGRVEDGLERIEELGRAGLLDQYYLFHAARADLLRRLNRNGEAAAAYEQAAALAPNPVEVDFLNRRLQQVRAA